MNSGAEAVENAVKIARKYTGRKAVISFERGFHGRTLLAMSLTSKVKPYKFGFGPFAPDTYKMAYPYYFRSPYGMAPEQTDREILRRLEDFFLAEVPAEEVAAIIMEPVQGEGGFIVPSKTFVQGIQQICDKYGIFRLKRQSIWSMIRGSVCRRGFTRKMSTRRFLRRRNFMSAA